MVTTLEHSHGSLDYLQCLFLGAVGRMGAYSPWEQHLPI
jgi:hypothetical protein